MTPEAAYALAGACFGFAIGCLFGLALWVLTENE